MTPPRRLLRSRNVVGYWKGEKFVLEQFARRHRITVAPAAISLLDAFDKPRTISEAARRFPQYEARSFARGIRQLARLEFLIDPDRPAERDLTAAWQDSFPAIYYQSSSRDVVYLTRPSANREYIERRLAEARQPPLYKSYPRRKLIALRSDGGDPGRSLDQVLSGRRTVRQFRNRKVMFTDFSAIMRGTWGQTGWIDAGPLGRLLIKSSPSAGARHPIECYVLAWRVESLTPGLYHYCVRSGRLERLRSGDFRKEAVRLASGQTWVRSAAFLCIMTAVTERVFWKYRMADAYRLFFLDAGHLGQTFVLLATSRDLGAFTTAALQESRIERLLGIDGVREFPVYLCGAGVPSRVASVSGSDPIASSMQR